MNTLDHLEQAAHRYHGGLFNIRKSKLLWIISFGPPADQVTIGALTVEEATRIAMVAFPIILSNGADIDDGLPEERVGERLL